MSNLRSDARKHASKSYKVGHMSRTFIEHLCEQISQVEGYWHQSERDARQYAAERDVLREKQGAAVEAETERCAGICDGGGDIEGSYYADKIRAAVPKDGGK